MDLNEIFEVKKINESSKKLYINNLIKLNDGNTIKNFNFINNSDVIMDKISDYKPNTQRNFIISIVSILKCLLVDNKKYQKLYDKYYTILIDFNKKLKDQTTKTDSENKNWITQEQLKNTFDQLREAVIDTIKNKKKITETEYNELLKLVIFSLYYLNEPRRNKDYSLMKVVKKYNSDMDKNFNYLIGNKFYFNNYKTNHTYNQQIVDINDKLLEIINIYLKYKPNSEFLLVNSDGNEFKNINDITRILNSIFKKKIGSSMMRKMYLTNKFGSMQNELNKTSNAMGTSASTISNNYIKQE
jgi:hypothetical protein